MKLQTKVLFVVLVLILSANIVQAQGLVGCTNDCTIKDLLLMIVAIINYLLSLAALVATLYIVWAGWNMVTAGGNEEKISKAKDIFSHAIIGFFLVLISFVLLDGITLALSSFSLKELLKFIFK